MIPLSQLHSQTLWSYPVLFSDTIPITIAGSPPGNDHRVLLCFHPQKTKCARSAPDDLFQTKEKQQHERIKVKSPEESTVCVSPWETGGSNSENYWTLPTWRVLRNLKCSPKETKQMTISHRQHRFKSSFQILSLYGKQRVPLYGKQRVQQMAPRTELDWDFTHPGLWACLFRFWVPVKFIMCLDPSFQSRPISSQLLSLDEFGSEEALSSNGYTCQSFIIYCTAGNSGCFGSSIDSS